MTTAARQSAALHHVTDRIDSTYPDDITRGNGQAMASVPSATPENRPYRTPAWATDWQTSAELATTTGEPEYIIDDVLEVEKHGIVAAPMKSLKTQTAIHMAISASTAIPFLSQFKVSKAVHVGFMSPESCRTDVLAIATRCANGMGINLAEANITWNFGRPLLNDPDTVAYLGDFVASKNIGLLIVDGLYLCFPIGNDAANMFSAGASLGGLEAITNAGASLMLVHHTKGSTRERRYRDWLLPPELSDVAYPALAQWARQWLLLKRSEPYQGSHDNRLILRAGGSSGHDTIVGLDVDEDDDGKWTSRVLTMDDVRGRAKATGKAGRLDRTEETRVRNLAKLRKAIAKHPDGASKTTLREQARMNNSTISPLLDRMTESGDVETVRSPNGQHTWYRLATETDS